MKHWGWLWVIILTVCACETRTPDGVIPPGKMERLLYDYHLAQSMARQFPDSLPYRYRLYVQTVFRKYGVDQAQFDSSMVWYTRHADRLFDIYERIDKRIVKEVGASTADESRSRYTSLSSQGDTANIWIAPTWCFLTPHSGDNVFSFSIPVDTSFRPGDRFMWHFYANWVSKAGERAAQAMLALTLDNDSVITTSRSVNRDGELRIDAPRTDLPLKRISGFIYIADTWSTTFKLLRVTDISLVRMHAQKDVSATVPASQSDTIAAERATPAPVDSLKGEETDSTRKAVRPGVRHSQSVRPHRKSGKS